jgi:subtilisin family serine protease
MAPLEMSSAPEDDAVFLPAGAIVDPSIAADVQAGRPRQVLVMLSDRTLRLRRASFQAKLAEGELDSYLQGVKGDLEAVKHRALAAAEGGATPLQTYAHLPLMVLRVDSPSALAALQAQPEVVAVVEDRAFYAVDMPTINLGLVGQPAATAAGALGANTAVAVLDTGTDYTRAPFNCTAPGQPATCPVVFAKDFAKEDQTADSGGYHGTNVAGIVLGVAPSTKIIALDVFDGAQAYASSILSALDWCIANKSKYNIVAINLSLGSGLFASACANDAFAPAVSAAKAAGILTVVASGNNASSDSISSPACAPGAVSVGAVYDHDMGPLATSVCSDATSATDKVACFSNSNSLLTLLAPGVGIAAAGVTMSGTSQAGPHVAGAIALLASAFASATPDSLVSRLITSRSHVTDTRNNLVKPRLDLPAALGLLPAGSGSTDEKNGTGGGHSGDSEAVAPLGKVVINDGAGFTRSPSVTVNVTATSGLATQVCLSTTPTCSNWMDYVPTVTFELGAGDGSKRIYVWWKNSEGAASAIPVSSSIALDTAPPNNGVIGIAVANGAATLGWSSFADAVSGIASYKLVSANSALADCSRGSLLYAGLERSFKTAKLPVGTTYFRVCAVDRAGNISAGTASSAKMTAR